MSKRKWSELTGTERQEEAGKLADREVCVNQSMLVEKSLSIEMFFLEDIENLYNQWEYAGHSKCEGEECKSDTTEDLNEYDLCRECFEDVRGPKEIFEWWVVSDWLIKRLEAKGEPILRTDWGDWWGRTCTGQAILLDGVMQEIAKELYEL